jgi:hypothetical protein
LRPFFGETFANLARMAELNLVALETVGG